MKRGSQTPENRLDLRQKFIFTCDPVSARDYDDALSLDHGRGGSLILGVHIADVSYYVKPGSKLDQEAYKKGTSVYLCDRVVPMLPERLSNGLCSLVPGEDRLTFSVFITFNRAREIVKAEFKRSVINSQARFTYEEVMKIIRGGQVAKVGKKEHRLIRELSALAQELRAKRFAAGALDLEVPEMQVELDGAGEMTGLKVVPYDESHQMIEECMVAANECVAKELWTHGVKILARLHDEPDDDKLQLLRAELRGIGVKAGNLANPKVFAQFLQTIKKHPLYPVISVMILRSMKKAVYSGERMGHFGLAKRYYAHFTSPIRRYPDLTLHRQLAAYIEGRNARVPEALLKRWAKHLSDKELEAQEAERDSIEEKKYQLLEREIASRCLVEYEAVVVKCMPFGLFVELPLLAVSGLVHVRTLSHRFVRFSEHDRTLGKWHVGDRLKVTVSRVDFGERKIDFIPVCDRKRR